MKTPASIKISNLSQILLVAYCIINAIIVIRINNELQLTQDALITSREQVNATSSLVLTYIELQEIEKKRDSVQVLPYRYD